MKTKHTQGEWEYSFDAYHKGREYNVFQGVNHIAKCAYMPNETEANAKLIAAAPDMLEALNHFMLLTSQMDYNYCREAIVKAEQAIKKATE